MRGDRNLLDPQSPEATGASRPAAVERARARLAAGAWVGSYVLAGAILDETIRAVGTGRTYRPRI